ncbi:hypothetical protein HW555_005088 [Spodoptera exigua]|uniref:Nuclease HARBI1 n=1 Tax=Spodoptera exigua TaxID=7107 RepID=A0A835GKR1_SPOEX|nr:hypothetical protein HW555_005088 [Spodoptera exigua]
MSPEEVVWFSAAYIIIRKTIAKRKKKRWWVREYLQQRESSSLLSSLRMRDGSFENFTRMSRTDFEILLNMVGPAIVKQDTKFRKSIDPHVRLAVTSRYLATGDSYGSLSYTFRVSKQVICHTIPKVCQELIKALNSFVKVNAAHNVVEGSWRRELRNNNMRNLNIHGRPPPQPAQVIRNHFAEYFSSAQGSVPWQTNQA